MKGLVSKEVISNKEEIISKKEEEEVISKKLDEVDSAAATMEGVLEYFENNICKPKELEYKKLYAFANNLSPGVIIMAIEEAVNYNAKNIKYIENILCSWTKKGLSTVEDVEKYKKVWNSQKNKCGKSKCSGWDFEQRDYDFEDLVQHGYLSVIKAVNLYKPGRSSFTTYCTNAVINNFNALLKGQIKHYREVQDETIINLQAYSKQKFPIFVTTSGEE